MRLRDPKSNLQLFLTRRCQLRCRYCAFRKGKGDMSLKTAVNGADFLLGARQTEVCLEYYGGEPLLVFDVLAESADHAVRKAGKLGKKLTFYTATNAIALDDRKLDWLASRKFFLELSIDGGSATHNSQRVGLSGRVDSYAAVEKVIARVRASGIQWGVIAVCAPENVPRLARDIEHMLDIGVRSFDLNYAFGAGWSREDQDAYFAQMLRLARRHRRSLAAGEIRIGNFWPIAEPGIINGALTVDTDGTLRQFNEWMFEDKPPRAPSPLGLGNVNDRPDINEIYLSQFASAYAIVRMYEGDPAMKRTILNNISAGFRFKRFFSALKAWVFGEAARPPAFPPAAPEWRL